MKIKNKLTGLILCLALSAASLTGCGGEKASEPVRSEAVQDTAKTDKKADTDKKETKAEKKNDKNALKEDNQIPEDGVITKEQMESIVSTEKRLTAFLIHGFMMEVRSKIRLNRNSK